MIDGQRQRTLKVRQPFNWNLDPKNPAIPDFNRVLLGILLIEDEFMQVADLVTVTGLPDEIVGEAMEQLAAIGRIKKVAGPNA